ncbi:MAG: cupin domain-containing protein [Alphaproteobacteria bacterium]|nr:cupin domain-containing protein [Alphaproteobacteria bacterium]
MPNNPSLTEEYSWGRMEWLADHSSHPGVQSSLAKMVVNPGAETPLHRHDNCSEVAHLLEGAIDLHVNDEVVSLTVGDTHVFPAYTPHRMTNSGDAVAVLVLSYSHGNRQYIALTD